jgi:hypothetical protein
VGQSLLRPHCTQVLLCVSQTGVVASSGEEQSAFVAQYPRIHWHWFAVHVRSGLPQSVARTHCTQTPCGSAQIGVLGVAAQSAFEPHTPEVEASGAVVRQLPPTQVAPPAQSDCCTHEVPPSEAPGVGRHFPLRQY